MSRKKLNLFTLSLVLTIMAVTVKVWAVSSPFLSIESSKDVITSKNAILNVSLVATTAEIKEFEISLYQDGKLLKSGTKVVENVMSGNVLYFQFDINKDLFFELKPNTEYRYTIALKVDPTIYNKDMYQNSFYFTTATSDESMTTEKVTKKNIERVTAIKQIKLKAKKPAVVKFKSVRNNKKRSITIKFIKAKNAKKYMVQYSTNKKFKKSVTKKTAKIHYTIKKLHLGKTYYIRVRGVNKKYVGNWSGTKRIVVKR